MYDWDVETAMAICKIESGGVATVSNWNDSHENCDGSHGLMQVGCLHGWSVDKLYIPEVNIKVAHDLWKANGWLPWSNSYKKLAMQ